MKKGFVISFDAIMALTIFVSMLFISTAYLGQVQLEAKNSTLLKEKAMDISTTLEKNGLFEDAINRDRTNKLRVFLNKLPQSLCVEINIYAKSDLQNPALSIIRPSCQKNYSDSATLTRSIVVNNSGTADFYLSKTTAWVKLA